MLSDLVNIDASRQHIKCNKGYVDAIDLFVDRNDSTGFVLIGRILKLDYIDVVSLPTNMILAESHYKVMYVIGNNNLDLISSVVSAVAKKTENQKHHKKSLCITYRALFILNSN